MFDLLTGYSVQDWKTAANYYLLRKKLKSDSAWPLWIAGFLIFMLVTDGYTRYHHVPTTAAVIAVAAVLALVGILARLLTHPIWFLVCSIITIPVAVWAISQRGPGIIAGAFVILGGSGNVFDYIRFRRVPVANHRPELVEAVEHLEREIKQDTSSIQFRDDKSLKTWRVALTDAVGIFVQGPDWTEKSDMLCLSRDDFGIIKERTPERSDQYVIATFRMGYKAMDVTIEGESLMRLKEWRSGANTGSETGV